MRGRGRAAGALLAATTLVLGATAPAAAQAAKPSYLPYVEFSPQDTAPQVTAKQTYNEAVLRYNQTLYDYHVTLEQHDQLVELYNNGSISPADRQKARDQAVQLRTKLNALRREVTSRAAARDEAARRAAATGVIFTP